MPAPFPESLLPVVENYEAIKQAFTACRVYSYHASPHYLIPRVIKHSPEITVTSDYIAIGNTGNAKLVLPITPRTPRDLLKLYKDIVLSNDGVYDVPQPFGEALKKIQFKVQGRPWGNVDPVVRTETLANLAGAKFKNLRNDRSQFYRQGGRVEVLTLDHADLITQVEESWATKKLGMKRGNVHYAQTFFESSHEYWKVLDVRGVMLFKDTTPVAVAIGNAVTADTWCCGYGYSNPKMQSLGTLAWHELAKLYPDYPLELDGPGGALTGSLHKMKARFTDQFTVQCVIRRKKWEKAEWA